MTEQELIDMIEAAALDQKIAPATLCRLAVGNNRLHRSLKDGKSCSLTTAARLREYVENLKPGAEV